MSDIDKANLAEGSDGAKPLSQAEWLPLFWPARAREVEASRVAAHARRAGPARRRAAAGRLPGAEPAKPGTAAA